MRVLFDQGTPAPLRKFLPGHTVKTAAEEGWDRLSNGELLRAAEDSGFDVLVTTDKNLRFQQDLSARRLAVVVLGNPRWPVLRNHVNLVLSAVAEAVPGTCAEIEIPA